MSTTTRTITVEACANGTITRANARLLNRVLGTTMSGSTTVADALAHIHAQGLTPRVIDAAALKGADKARHTREVTRSSKAQDRRMDRRADAVTAWEYAA